MKTILQVQKKQLTVYEGGRRRFGIVDTFTNTSSGLRDFNRFLLRHRNTGFVVLLDLEDEQIHLQKIPRVSRREQRNILRHHQRKLYGDSSFTSGMVAKGKRGADSRLDVTQIGLPSDMDDCTWLTQLNNANTSIRSFHWMSLLIFPLVEATGISTSVALMLIRVDSYDDRIMVFHDGRPIICRRFTEQSINTADTDESGQLLAERMIQTITYMENLTESVERELTSANSMSVVAIGDFAIAEIECVNQQLHVLGIEPVRAVALASIAECLPGKYHTPETLAEIMACSVLKHKAFSCSLIFRGARFQQRRIRHSMHAISVSLLAAAAVAPAASRYIEMDINKLESAALEIELQARQLKQAHLRPEWSNQFTVEAIRESVVHVKVLERANQSTPFHFLVSLSEHLTRHPQIELISIRWNSVETDLSDPAGRNSGNRHMEHSIEGDASVPVDQFSTVVTGYVGLGADGYALAMNRFRSFVASIRASSVASVPGSEVTVVNVPFENSTTVRGDTSPGQFTIEVNASRKKP